MAYLGPVCRWEVYWADLDPAVGSEQAGSRRPVLVVSTDAFNKAMPVVTVVPLTKVEGKNRRIYPFEVKLPKDVVGNGLTPLAMPYHVRTVSKTRLLERAGALTHELSKERVEDALLAHLGIALEDD